MDISYNTTTLLATPVVTTDQGGAIKSTHWVVLGSLGPVDCRANTIWKEAEEDILVSIPVPDIFILELGPSSNVTVLLALDVRFASIRQADD